MTSEADKPKISVILPVLAPTAFHVAMTEFCIKTLRTHADNPFELVVVEAVHYHFGYSAEDRSPDLRVDRYLNFNPKIGGVAEINAGVRAATGDFIVHAGNDVIVPPHWDTELLLPFKERKDCGVSCLAAKEPNYTIGAMQPIRGGQPGWLVEGMFSPFMMFRRGWEFDESYKRIYQDSDMILRMYEAGLRAYRNNRTHVLHFGSVTNTTVDVEEHNKQIAPDERLFYQRWGGSPLMMFGMIRSGQLIYGREHEAWTRPIHLHQ